MQLEQHPADTAGIHLSIAHPEAAMSGSIELIDVPEHPCLASRYRARVAAACAHSPSPAGCGGDFAAVNDSEWSAQVCQPLAKRNLPGLLGGECFAVTAPDGGRLDLYQLTQ